MRQIMLEAGTFLSFNSISTIHPFKKQELAEIKKHITTLQSKEDVKEEDIDEYLRTLLSEQKVMQYFTHAQHIRHIFSQYIIYENNPVEFSFPYQSLISRIQWKITPKISYSKEQKCCSQR